MPHCRGSNKHFTVYAESLPPEGDHGPSGIQRSHRKVKNFTHKRDPQFFTSQWLSDITMREPLNDKSQLQKCQVDVQDHNPIQDRFTTHHTRTLPSYSGHNASVEDPRAGRPPTYASRKVLNFEPTHH